MFLKNIDPDERVDPMVMKISYAEKMAHIYRYNYAKKYIENDADKRGLKRVKVLDIACGLGYGSAILSDIKHSHIYAVDISQNALAYAKKTYHKKNISWIKGDIATLNLGKVDYIISYETIEHISKNNAIRALNNLYKILKHKGSFIVSSPNRNVTSILKFFGLINKHHIYEYKPKELSNLLLTQQFIIESIIGQTIANPILYLLARKRAISSKYFYPNKSSHPNLSQNFIIISKK